MSIDVIARLRRIGYAVRRSPAGEARAGKGGRGRRPATRSRFLAEGEQGAEASIFSCGWSLIAGQTYDFDGSERGPEPWVLVQHTLSGMGQLQRDGRTWVCGPGSVLVLPMPDRHRYWLPSGGTWEFAYVSLRGAAPLRAAARLVSACGPVIGAGEDTALVQSLITVVADALSEDLGPHALSERGYGLAMRLLEIADVAAQAVAPPLPSPYDDLVAWCLPRLRGLAVADLARHCGQSREHFSRQFRMRCGLSPGRLLAQLRQAQALAVLRGGGGLAQAAEAAGLRSSQGLRRSLRRHLGWSP